MAHAIRRDPNAFSLDPSSKASRRIEDPAHLAFIRKLPSVISGKYGCEACHIRAQSAVFRKKMTGKAQKPDDAWTLPLTPEEHRDQHSGNELEFWRRHGVDPFATAAKLYEVSGSMEAALRVLSEARSKLWPSYRTEDNDGSD